MSKKLWWTSGSGEIELEISKAQVRGIPASGAADIFIDELLRYPSIKNQLAKLTPERIAKVLKEYGAWSKDELADEEANLQRLLWIACGDLRDEATEKGISLEPSKRVEYYFGTIKEHFGEFESDSVFVFVAPKGELEDTEERISVQFRDGAWEETDSLYWFDGYGHKPVESRKITKREFEVMKKVLSYHL